MKWLTSILFLIFPLLVSASQQVAAPPDYEAMGRKVIAQLIAKKYDELATQFTPQMKAALPGTQLADGMEKLFAHTGLFKSVTSARTEEQQGYHIVHLVCAFERDTWEFIIVIDGEGHIVGLRSVTAGTQEPWKAPAYAVTDSFSERSVTVTTGRWQLPGTLTLPNGDGPFPAVVLVHGSGAHDRDETIGPNKDFKDLAFGLASRGIAVLRYVKRNKQYGLDSVDDMTTATMTKETVDDARSAVTLLAGTKEIDPKHIYVVGHSLGAYMGPRIAKDDPQVAGLVLMAGNTRPVEDLVVEQMRYIFTVDGQVTPQGQKQIDEAEETRRQVRNPELKQGMTVKMLGQDVPASYFLDLRDYHPEVLAASLKIPIFVMRGERDYQVALADFEGWKKALASQPTAKLKLYPGLNHLFMLGTGPSTEVEYAKPNHIQEDVVRDIAEWILGQKTAKQN